MALKENGLLTSEEYSMGLYDNIELDRQNMSI
jgi:hypothetical protein